MIDNFHGPNDFLSNFFLCSVVYEGVEYRSSEHAYQAAKSTDAGERARIQACPTPGLAKREGRKIQNLRPMWDDIKVGVMADILRIKFRKNSYLANLLLSTGDEPLVEGNTWHDTFWGVCDGRGKNHLGQLLMRIRKELRNG